MENTREVTLHLDLDNELVASWFERLMDSSRHPIYQNGIRVVRSVDVTVRESGPRKD